MKITDTLDMVGVQIWENRDLKMETLYVEWRLKH